MPPSHWSATEISDALTRGTPLSEVRHASGHTQKSLRATLTEAGYPPPQTIRNAAITKLHDEGTPHTDIARKFGTTPNAIYHILYRKTRRAPNQVRSIQIATLHAQGYAKPEIAKHLALSLNTVNEYLRRNEIPTNLNSKKSQIQSRRRVLSEIRTGSSLKDAAEEIGVTTSAIDYWRRTDPEFAADLKQAKLDHQSTWKQRLLDHLDQTLGKTLGQAIETFDEGPSRSTIHAELERDPTWAAQVYARLPTPSRRKIGRSGPPTSTDWHSTYLAALNAGLGRVSAARAAGVADRTVRLHRRRFPQFDADITAVLTSATHRTRRAILCHLRQGTPLTHAVTAAGTDLATIQQWRHTAPHFDQALRDA